MIIIDNVHYKAKESDLQKEILEILKRPSQIRAVEIKDDKLAKIIIDEGRDIYTIKELDVPIKEIQISKSAKESRLYLAGESCEIVYSWKDYTSEKRILEISQIR